MKSFSLNAAGVFAAGLFLCACVATSAAHASPEEDDAGMAQQLGRDLGWMFDLSVDLKLDPALRKEAEGLAQVHVARMRGLIPAWLQEERRLAAGGKVAAHEVYFAVFARLLNEAALWQLAPGDGAYEQATLAAVRASPGICAIGWETHFPDFATRIVRLQAMPPAARAAAMATEQRLLAAWGTKHAAPPPWPDPLPQAAAMEAVGRIRAAGATERPPVALAPILASAVLAQRGRYEDLHWEVKCLLQRWWLELSLAQGRAPAEALAAFRYGTLVTATQRFGDGFEREAGASSAKASRATKETKATAATKADPAAPPAYPKLAARFDVTGSTRIARRFDGAGKPVQASVTGRDITVRGIRGVRPVAFEDTFDALAVRYALAPDVAAGPDGPLPTFEMKWQLDPAATGKDASGAKP